MSSVPTISNSRRLRAKLARRCPTNSEIRNSENTRNKLVWQAKVAWVAAMIADKERWNAYMVAFMFNHLPGSEKPRIEQMTKEVERFYALFVTRVVRYPRRKSNFERLPRLFGLPEYPVPKSTFAKLETVSVNDGLHVQAILLVPRDSRLKNGAKNHIQDNLELYIGKHKKLRDIHLRRITETPERAAEYTFKWEKRNPRFADYTIILPRPASEVGSDGRNLDR